MDRRISRLIFDVITLISINWFCRKEFNKLVTTCYWKHCSRHNCCTGYLKLQVQHLQVQSFSLNRAWPGEKSKRSSKLTAAAVPITVNKLSRSHHNCRPTLASSRSFFCSNFFSANFSTLLFRNLTQVMLNVKQNSDIALLNLFHLVPLYRTFKCFCKITNVLSRTTTSTLLYKIIYLYLQFVSNTLNTQNWNT